MYCISDEYASLAEDVINSIEELMWIKETDVRIAFLSSDFEKKTGGGRKLVLADCKKVEDIYKPLCPYDFIITVYEPNCEELDDEQMKILMWHELKHVGVDEKDGELKYVVVPHDVEEFRSIIDAVGLDWDKKEG